MNEELLNAFTRKMTGYLAAAKQIGVPCETCGQWLDPTDTGVNPATGEREWVTYCCGNVHRFVEKVDMGFRGLIADE